MIIFKLPDLGEGLPDAIIREWYVKEGDEVKVDQPLVAMETAKALVDVPAPFAGKIEKLFGKPNDTVDTGQPLIGFVGEGQESINKDKGTVVGKIEEGEEVWKEITPTSMENTIQTEDKVRPKVTPAVRALAKRLGVNLDEIVTKESRITAEVIKRLAEQQKRDKPIDIKQDAIPLSPVRRAMILSMTESHRRVVPVTLADDVNISLWVGQQDITLRIIRALISACEVVPILNATFDDSNMVYYLNETINLGIAIDTPHGLYVPVINDAANQNEVKLREKIEQFKQQAHGKSIAKKDLHGATIILSNFGALAGRYANPIVIPPMVAIVGVGKARDGVTAVNGQPTVGRLLPLSITVDHRLVTGGEVARFLQVMLEQLSK